MRAYLKVVTILGKPQRCDILFTKNESALITQCKKDAQRALDFCAFIHLFVLPVEEGKNALACLTDWKTVYVKHIYSTPDEMIELFPNKPEEGDNGVVLWAKSINLL